MNRVLVILLLTFILAVVLTAGFIVNKRIENFYIKSSANSLDDKEKGKEDSSLKEVSLYEEYHLPIDDNTNGATISQRFDINPIKFSKHVYEDEKTYAYYLQIDGLIDDEIERGINERLKNEIIDYGHYAYDMIANKKENEYVGFDKYVKDKYVDSETTEWNSCVDEAILFNGANVLSISMINTNGNMTQRNRFLNFNLANGEEIKIEEIFTKDYSVLENFKDSLYSSLGEGDIIWDEDKHYNEETGEYETWRRKWHI